MLFALAHYLQINKKEDISVVSQLFEQAIELLTANAKETREKLELEIERIKKIEIAEDQDIHEHQQKIDKTIISAQEKSRIKSKSLSESISLIYIVYMRACRREGEKQGRSVYAAARKNGFCSYHVHIASALMEYHVSKDPTIAGRLFESALKLYTEDQDSYSYIVMSYMDFLISCNNDTSMFIIAFV